MDLSKEIMRGRSTAEQQRVVAGVLLSLLPEEAAVRFRKWFPLSKVGWYATIVVIVWLRWPRLFMLRLEDQQGFTIMHRQLLGGDEGSLITTLGFGWLVGPSEVKEVDVVFNGHTEKWRSGVQIKKCRYLEASGCVGMCVNMCK